MVKKDTRSVGSITSGGSPTKMPSSSAILDFDRAELYLGLGSLHAGDPSHYVCVASGFDHKCLK